MALLFRFGRYCVVVAFVLYCVFYCYACGFCGLCVNSVVIVLICVVLLHVFVARLFVVLHCGGCVLGVLDLAKVVGASFLFLSLYFRWVCYFGGFDLMCYWLLVIVGWVGVLCVNSVG